MTFTEYLLADGTENLAEYLSGINEIAPIPDAFYSPLVEKLKMYFVVGGMPEPVLVWTEDGDIKETYRVLSDILMSYENDFAKHADPTDVPKIQLIWDSLPSQPARENKKFLYSAVKDGARAREYENALNWLCSSARSLFSAALSCNPYFFCRGCKTARSSFLPIYFRSGRCHDICLRRCSCFALLHPR